MSSAPAILRAAPPRGRARVLSFTFDDGPDETWTPLVLDALARCEVTGTFFMVGERVLAQPDLADAVRAAGHDVQLHCHRHVRHTELTKAALYLDTETALAALACVGVRPKLWRTPWGVCTEASARVAELFGLRLVHWSIDAHDWRGDESRAMLAQCYVRLTDGGSVLMHDALGPGAQRRGCENTLALLPALAAAARAHGLALAPVPHQVRDVPRAISQPAIGVPA
ncbi:MAG: polysaccharide deacetylase family protein [Solirubrobacteraceae bacterium]